MAAQNGHVSVLNVLLTAGAAPDAARTDGATPLWIAAQMGHERAVRALLRAGAFVDAQRHVSTGMVVSAQFGASGRYPSSPISAPQSRRG